MMMAPQDRAKIYNIITRESTRRFGAEFSNAGDEKRWIEAEISRYAQTIPFMHGATLDNFLDYCVHQADTEFQQREDELNEGVHVTPHEFLQAALDFDSVGNNIHSKDTKLAKLQRSGRVPPIPLGRIYGDKLNYLIPGTDSLPHSEFSVQGFKTPYNAASTVCTFRAPISSDLPLL